MLEPRKDNTILVIEDEEDVRRFVCRVLELEGYYVLQAANGLGGLKLARERKIAMVLLDLRLPDCSGWEVLKKMKADPLTSSVPVVIVTASAAISQKDKALGLGARKYLVKPLSASFLRETVSSILSQGGDTHATEKNLGTGS